MSVVFVKASRRAKAHVRAGSRRGSSVAKTKRLHSLKHKVDQRIYAGGTKNLRHKNKRIWQLERLSANLEKQRMSHVTKLVSKRSRGRR